MQAYLDLNQILVPTDSSYGDTLFRLIKNVCTMDSKIDMTLILNNDSYRHEQWNVCLSAVRNCFTTYDELLTSAFSEGTSKGFPGLIPQHIIELKTIFNGAFDVYRRIFTVNTTGNFGVNF